MDGGWNTAVPGWEERLLAGRLLVPELPLFDAEAARAVRIFRRMRLPDVPGNPTFAEAGFEWAEPVVAALFGSYDAAAKRRMIQEAFLLVPKKNGKSTAAAGIMVTALIMNCRPMAEAVLIAPTKEIADITYSQAAGMIRLDERLAAIFEPTRHQRTIFGMGDYAGIKLMIKSADVDVVTGGKQTYTLIDETHVFATKAHADEIFIELRGALAARPDGFLMQITTQSKERPAGVFKAELQRARQVRDGEVNLPLLPVLYELPDRLQADGGWKNRALWRLVNPNLGRSLDEAFLAREVAAAEDEGAHKLSLIASQHFNVEIGVGQKSDGWAGAEYWERRTDPRLDLASLLERSEVVVVGIDGGGLDDLLGLAVLGRCAETKHWLAWCYAWAHRSVLERRKTIASTLRDFDHAGELTIVTTTNPLADRYYEAMREAAEHAREAGSERWLDEDAAIVSTLLADIKKSGFPDDIAALRDVVQRVKDTGKLAEVGVDPAGLGMIVDALESIGITEAAGNLIGVGQGYRMMNAIQTGERRLENGTLWHGPSGLMEWCVGNVKIERTATAIRATKQNAGDAKIDPWCALMDASDRMSLNPAARGKSFWEIRRAA